MMVLPALLGYWVDTRLGTVILFTFLGLLFGMGAGIWQLMKIVAQQNKEPLDHEYDNREQDNHERENHGG